MGRHEVVSSPLRSPAVLLGVPVATVLATWSTTALLGGVVPSAEEAPLRAEEPTSAAPVPGAVPAAPAGASGLRAGPGVAWPAAVEPGAVEPGTVELGAVDLADRVLPAPDGARTTAIRVIRVADETPSPAPTTAERSGAPERVRVVPLTERRPTTGDGAVRDAAGAAPAAATGTATAVASEPVRDAAPAARSAASSAPAASPSDDAPAELGATARSVPADEPVAESVAESVDAEERSAGDVRERENAVLDLDTPPGGLSVLSFG